MKPPPPMLGDHLAKQLMLLGPMFDDLVRLCQGGVLSHAQYNKAESEAQAFAAAVVAVFRGPAR